MGLFKSTALVFGVQVLQLVAGLLLVAMVTRSLGPEGQGVYALLLATISLAVTVAELGGNVAATYLMARGQFPPRAVVATVLTLSPLLGLPAVAAAAAAFLWLGDSYFRDIGTEEMAFTLASIPLAHLLSLCGGLVLGLSRPVAHAWLGLLQLVIALAVLGIAHAVGGLSIAATMAGWATGLLAAVMAALALLARASGLGLGLHRPLVRPFLSYGIQIYPAAILWFMRNRLDAFIVNALLGVAGLGYYSAAVALAGAVGYLANAAGTSLFPYFSGASPEESARLAAIACRNTVFAALCGAGALLLVSPWLVPVVLGEAMIPALLPLWLLTPGILAAALNKVLSVYFSGTGKPIYSSGAMAAHVVLIGLLNLLLVPYFGVAGAALASSIAHLATAVGALVVFLNQSRTGLWRTLVLQPEDVRRYLRVMSTVKAIRTASR